MTSQYNGEYNICMILYFTTDLMLHIYKKCLYSVCTIPAVLRYRASVDDTYPEWAFPCRCTSGCDTDTGECKEGGECIGGRPPQFPWSGRGCRTSLISFLTQKIICNINHSFINEWDLVHVRGLFVILRFCHIRLSHEKYWANITKYYCIY